MAMTRKIYLTTLLLCAFLITEGCGEAGMRMEYETDEFLSMNEAPELYPGVPAVLPRILVDKNGYSPTGEKVAIFTSKELPQIFYVVDDETGESVYTGAVTTKKNVAEGANILGYGRFTDLAKEGSYHIECEGLGQSYSFIISDELIRDSMKDALEVYDEVREKKVTVSVTDAKGEDVEKSIQGGWITEENGSQTVLTAAESMMTLLEAYELFPDSFAEFTNDAGENKLLDVLYHESVWMLSMQDEVSGGIYRSLVDKSSASGESFVLTPIDDETSAAFAAVMAKFSYVYKDVDQDYASLCLKAADTAWKYLEKKKAVTAGEDFAPILGSAAAELYRASGLMTYYTYTADLIPSSPDIVSSHWTLYSSITYMLTRKSVAVSKCQSLMKKLMKQGELLSQATRNDMYLVTDVTDNSVEELLWNAVIVSTSDYVLTNNEYANVILNHEHYFRGRNESSTDYIYEGDEYKLKDLRSNACYIYMLSQILSKDYYVAPTDNDY